MVKMLDAGYFQLDDFLTDYVELWRPQPFKQTMPLWCSEHVALAGHVQSLTDEAVAALLGDNRALWALLAQFIPPLAALDALCCLPSREARHVPPPDKGRAIHLAWEIPGRKAGQIAAFAQALGPLTHPILDWCGGKGHLGRHLAAAWQQPVMTLDHDPELCRQGWTLAQRAGVDQQFRVGDALAAPALSGVAGRHAVALHACGDLHLTLIRQARQVGLAALDIAPCCYNRTAAVTSSPLSGGSLVLSRDDLRLAVSDTVTASAREVRLRQKEQAWKLGFVAWRTQQTGEAYRSFKPIPDAWLKGDFGDFCRALAQREQLSTPTGLLTEFEALGWQRSHQVNRLNLVRLAFRRPLEIWLALDRARCLREQGYQVDIAEFCPRQLTPRNILLSARG